MNITGGTVTSEMKSLHSNSNLSDLLFHLHDGNVNGIDWQKFFKLKARHRQWTVLS